jgi:hypothetical protein
VHELLLSLVKDNIGTQQTDVTVGSRQNSRLVTLNGVGDNGLRTNDMVTTRTRIDLDDVPNTPTYRMQQLQELKEMVSGLALPPEVSAMLLPLMVSHMDLTDKDEVEEIIRNATGQPKPENQMTEEDVAQAQEQQAAAQNAQAIQDAMMQAQLRKAEAEAVKAEKEAGLKEAQTEKALVDAAVTEQHLDHGIENHAFDLLGRAEKQLGQNNEQ